MSFVSIDKICSNASKSFSIRLDGDLLDVFNDYCEAYTESTQEEVEPKQIIASLVKYALHHDGKFRKWRKSKQDEGV